MADGSHLENR